MKKILFAALAIVALTGVLGSCQSEKTQISITPQSSIESSQESFADSSVETSEESPEQKIDNMLENEHFLGVAFAVKNGEVIYDKSFNPKDDGQLFDSKTVFRIASVTKQFTAGAVMLLQEQGKLSVNDTLDKYFPDYRYAKEITLHHLLCMRSGIKNYTDLIMYAQTEDDIQHRLTDNAEQNKAAIMDLVFQQELNFTPDEKYKYSNSNYFLLADIIRQVSGMTYEEYLTENIFKPLHMTATGFYDSYELQNTVIAQPTSSVQDYFNLPAMSFGAGDILSNAEDLLKWLKTFEGGSIFSDDSIQAMTTNYSGDNDSEEYGYGLMIKSDGIYHGGNLPSYTAAVYTSPKNKYSVILLSNEASAKLITFMNQIRYELCENE